MKKALLAFAILGFVACEGTDTENKGGDSTKTDSAKTEVKTDSVKTEVKTDSVKTEVKTDSVKAEVKTDSAKAGKTGK
jgi:hypothetical protein